MRESRCATARFPGSILVALALALSSLAALAPAALARDAYVTNFQSGSVSVIDTQTNQAVGPPIKVGVGPGAIAIAPDGMSAYVANSAEDSLSVINTQTNAAVGPPIGLGAGTEEPDAIAITPDGKTAYVVNKESNNVSVVNIQTDEVVGMPIPVGEHPYGIAITPDGGSVLVSNSSSESVSVIDTQTNQAVGPPIKVGVGPRAIAITPDGKRAYVVNAGSNDVSVIETQTKQVLGSPIPVGVPDGIAITPDGKSAYVGDSTMNAVSVIDTQTNQVVGSPIGLGKEPRAIAIAPDGMSVYVAESGGADTVVPISTQTDRVGTPIGVGKLPVGIAIIPDQPPHASFTHLTARPQVPVAFDASSSSDPDGTVAGFEWGFGDGVQEISAGSSASHAYYAPGIYKATLTLTDDEGCSTAFIFTGQTALCNGSARASTSQIVHVSYPAVRLICPRRAGHGGCKFRLQIVSAKHRGKVESAVASLKLRAGRSGILSLKPKAAYRDKLAAARNALAQETAKVDGSRRTRVVMLEIVR